MKKITKNRLGIITKIVKPNIRQRLLNDNSATNVARQNCTILCVIYPTKKRKKQKLYYHYRLDNNNSQPGIAGMVSIWKP